VARPSFAREFRPWTAAAVAATAAIAAVKLVQWFRRHRFGLLHCSFGEVQRVSRATVCRVVPDERGLMRR
jgi:hypothetical protein